MTAIALYFLALVLLGCLIAAAWLAWEFHVAPLVDEDGRLVDGGRRS